MKPTSIVIKIGLMALLAVGTATAHATGTPIIDFTGGASVGSTATRIFGLEFRVSNPITINCLGLWDEGSNGLVNSHAVGLWNFDGSVLLASTTVDNTSTPLASTSPDGRWLANSIADILLTPGTYVLGALYGGKDSDALRALTTSTAIPDVTFGVARVKQFAGVLEFPSDLVGSVDDGYFGPMAFRSNVTAVPEPGTVSLFMGSVCGAIFLLRRRR